MKKWSYKFNRVIGIAAALFFLGVICFSSVSALAAASNPIGTSQGFLKYDSNGNLSVGANASAATRFQIVSSGSGSDTFALKVLDTAGTTPMFSVRSDGVVTVASTTNISGPAIFSNSVQLSALASSNLCLITNSSGFLTTSACGGSGATSTPASYITPGAFNSNTGPTGDYSFPGSLSLDSTTVPTGGVLYVSGSVGIGKPNPGTALDVNGTTTATQFAGGGAGLTGVNASAVPWSGITATPTTTTGYGITDIYAWAKTPAKPAYALSEINSTMNGSQLAGNITINTSGNVSSTQFYGGGAGLTGVTVSSVPWSGVSGKPTNNNQFVNDSNYLQADQVITLSGAVTGTGGVVPGSESIAATMGTNPYYPITAGAGNGICFWNDCTNYKIYYGSGAEYQYGTVGNNGGSGGAIKFSMNNQAGRGWVWGVIGSTPVFAIDIAGRMQLAGTFTNTGMTLGGNLNTASRGQTDWYNIGAGSIGAYTIYGYTAICTGNNSGACNSTNGVVLGLVNTSAAVNIPNSGTIFFNNGYGVSVGKYLNTSALDVVGTVTASGGFVGSGAGLTGVTRLATIDKEDFNFRTAQTDYLCGFVVTGSCTMSAADMIAGRVVRIKVDGVLYNGDYYENQDGASSANLIFAWGPYQIFNKNYVMADYSVAHTFQAEVILSFVSATRFIAYEKLIINSPNSFTVSWAGSFYGDYSFPAGSYNLHFYGQDSGNWPYQGGTNGFMGTVEYVN